MVISCFCFWRNYYTRSPFLVQNLISKDQQPLVTGCASIDKNAPINDDYSTSFRWSEYDSTALNLLRSADMDTKYDDVNSKEDISDIRDRNSTAGNILGNVLNFSAFGIGGLLYSVGQNDDDLDPKFGGVTYVTYVTYVPVHTDDLSSQEQLSVVKYVM
jgi:hypothetical protein